MALTLGLVAAGTFLYILAGHWFPWRKAFGRDLHRVEAYAYGVTGIVGAALLAFQLAPAVDPSTVLIVATASAGAATLLSKAIDDAIEFRHRMKDLEDLAHVRTSATNTED